MNGDSDADARQRRALELRRAHYRQLAAYALWQGCNTVEAQQVANDSLAQLTIYEINRGRSVEKPRAWLHEVVRRKSLELFRDRRKYVPFSELPDDAADPNLGPEKHAEWVEIIEVMLKLPDRQKRPLILSARGASIAEIAEDLGCTPDAAKQRLHRARQALRDKLGMDSTSSPSASNKGRV